MRCYEVTRTGQRLGIPVDLAGDFLEVDRDKSKAFLSDQLVAQLDAQSKTETFELSQARLLRCDVDKRSELWLLPETEKTRNHVLVRCSWRLHDCRNICVSIEGEGSEILFDSSFREGFENSGYHVKVLATLAPDGLLKFDATLRKLTQRPFLLWSKTKYSLEQELLQLTVNEDGSLDSWRVSGGLSWRG